MMGFCNGTRCTEEVWEIIESSDGQLLIGFDLTEMLTLHTRQVVHLI